MMRVPRAVLLLATTLAVALLVSGAAVADPGNEVAEVIHLIEDTTGKEVPQTGTPADGVVHDDGSDAAPPEEGDAEAGRDGGLGDEVRDALFTPVGVVSALGVLAATVGMLGFALVTRYVSPKEALKNPQRSMLYGFVLATPGVNLKRLAEEFGMKSSSILWHMRKLENADLVRSEQVNGFRVFHSTQGGVAAKELGRAVTAIQNRNARRVVGAAMAQPGATTTDLARRLELSPGNVRWHVRRLRDAGLLEEMVRRDERAVYATPLGQNAVEAHEGAPTVRRPARSHYPGHDAVGLPTPDSFSSQQATPVPE